jgi:hypothetical protein
VLPVVETLVVLGGSATFLTLRRGAFGFWEDEGINLLKAAMVSAGHPLYQEVYSDQAPLFTWFLVPFHRLLGGDYHSMTYVGVLLGALALTAAFALGRALVSRETGLAAVLLLGALAPVQKFASSIVLPIPGLALAVLAVLLAWEAGRRTSPRLALASGVCLGLSFSMKMMFAYFFPVAVLAMAMGAPAGVALGRPLALRMGAGGAAVVALVAAFSHPFAMLGQAIAPHVAAQAAYAHEVAQRRQVLLLAPGFPALHAATILALAVLLVTRRRVGILLGVWWTIVATWLLLNNALLAHHLPELFVPAALAIACALNSALPAVLTPAAPHRTLLTGASVLVAILSLGGVAMHERHLDHWRRYHDGVSLETLETFAERIRGATTPTDLVLVDRPSLAYLAGRQVPPALAMISEKRIRTGALTDADLDGAIERHRPAVVALASPRFQRFMGFRARLEAEYQLVYSSREPSQLGTRVESFRLFVRRQED